MTSCFNVLHLLAKRKRADPRTNLEEWEFEEHEVRLKILAKELEYENTRLKLIQQKKENEAIEHKARMELISAQIIQITNNNNATFLVQSPEES